MGGGSLQNYIEPRVVPDSFDKLHYETIIDSKQANKIYLTPLFPTDKPRVSDLQSVNYSGALPEQSMSKTLKAFGEALLTENMFKKLFAKQTPGKRIAPPQAGDNDSKLQLRLDAGELVDGSKKVYLQVNSQAKNDALKKYRDKHGSHANLATATVDPNTPEKDQKKVFIDMWKDMESQARAKLK